MADEKQKMTSQYKAVFVFSITMTVLMYVLYAGNYLISHRASALPFLFWCYQTWLIYKQQNAKLIGFIKAMLWLGGISFAIISLFLLLDTNAAIYGFSYITLILGAVMLGMYYEMLQFFKQQLVNPSVTKATSNNSIASDDDYLHAVEEFESELRDKGLWARCFAEADGNEALAKAKYLKVCATNLSNNKNTSQPEIAPIKIDDYSSYSVHKLLREKLYTVKKHPYLLGVTIMILKNGNAAVKINNEIKVYDNEKSCLKAINNKSVSFKYSGGLIVTLKVDDIEDK